ncbi:MAG TPA: outer membrane beta-barrel protein [Nitrospirales bacterium]|nr:outer membrane beta-barrel protein [Nitrospirales bacterium]
MLAARSLTVLLLVLVLRPTDTGAEWYVAGQGGAAFADRLTNIDGTGSLRGLRAPDFDLKNSAMIGAKLGYFPGHGWVGVEGEAFHTSPHIKELPGVAPGIHLRVTTVALNLVVRYPGVSIQPYAGMGIGIMMARLGESATTQKDNDTRTGLNLLAGVRFFVTPYVSVFTEYKLSQASFRFDQAFGATSGFIGDYTVQFTSFGIAYHF